MEGPDVFGFMAMAARRAGLEVSAASDDFGDSGLCAVRVGVPVGSSNFLA